MPYLHLYYIPVASFLHFPTRENYKARIIKAYKKNFQQLWMLMKQGQWRLTRNSNSKRTHVLLVRYIGVHNKDEKLKKESNNTRWISVNHSPFHSKLLLSSKREYVCWRKKRRGNLEATLQKIRIGSSQIINKYNLEAQITGFSPTNYLRQWISSIQNLTQCMWLLMKLPNSEGSVSIYA